MCQNATTLGDKNYRSEIVFLAVAFDANAPTGISLAGLGKGVYVVKAGQKTVKVSK